MLSFNKALNQKDLNIVEETLEELYETKEVQGSHELVACYNRTLCKLGVSYFKKGEFSKCK